MRALTSIGVWLVLSAGAGVRTAGAQNTPASPPPGRRPARAQQVRISVNAGTQPGSTTFTGAAATTIYTENADINTTYHTGNGPFFDGGVLSAVAGGFHVGVSVSSFVKRSDGEIAATIPHPFFYKTPRSIAGVAGSLERREIVTHVQAAYVMSAGRKLDIALSAGPSWFRVRQDLVTGVTFTERYPYDTATFGAASSTTVSANKIGFNAGVDVGVRLSRSVGIGGLVRFSRASVELPLPGAPTTAKSNAGGVQVGGGLRVYF
jgi:hypothetical protein